MISRLLGLFFIGSMAAMGSVHGQEAAPPEAARSTRPPSYVRKTDSGYLISLERGGQHEMADNPDKGEQSKTYSYVKSPLEPRFVLFNVQFWEGYHYEFLNRADGAVTEVLDEPFFSPSKNRFLAVSGDAVAQYNTCAFQIWKVDKNGIHQEFSENCDGAYWFPTNGKWLSDSKLRFTKAQFNPADGSVIQQIPVTVSRIGKKWELKEEAIKRP